MKYQQLLEIGESPDLVTLRAQLISVAHELGFSRMGAFVITELPDGSKSFAMIHNAPRGFLDSVTKNDESTQRDPVHKRLKRSTIPFAYSQALYVQEGAGDLWEEQAPFDYRNGVAVALRMPGKQFMLGFDGPDELPRDDEAMTHILGNLQLAAVHAQDAALKFLVPGPKLPGRPLSPRELQTLRWSAQGKTAEEVAQILGVTTHTVTYYMRCVFEKLGVSNKHHAVGLAQSLGLI